LRAAPRWRQAIGAAWACGLRDAVRRRSREVNPGCYVLRHAYHAICLILLNTIINGRILAVCPLLVLPMKRREHGAALLEALLAIAMFSFGLMGLAGVQAAALRAQGNALLQAQANGIAIELGERLRANRLGVQGGAYAMAGEGNSGASTGSDSGVGDASCEGALAPASRAACDLRAATATARADLPGGKLVVDLLDTGVARIALMWTDASLTTPATLCDQAGSGDMQRCCVRAVAGSTRCLNVIVALE